MRGRLALLAMAAVFALPGAAQPNAAHLSRGGVVRAQAVVDSVFLNRRAGEGTIDGGDWASYLMARLGVVPLPDTTGIEVLTDSAHIVFSGRISDLPAEGRAMLGPLAALLDSTAVLAADVVMVPADTGLVHFRLRGVSVAGFPIPEMVLQSMLFNIGDRYPALTRSGRDLYVQIPPDGKVTLVAGAVRLSAPPVSPGSRPPA
jgi:hypothetical protein